MDINQLIPALAVNALPVLFAITVHEAAHGYAARHFGDNTAWAMGRVTLNPIKHIDPVGTILIPLALMLLNAPFVFGYAKPVPVRFGNLRNPKRDMIWVALAGPGANLAQAWIWGVLFYLIVGAGISESSLFFNEMCQAGIKWNVLLFAFNLFPLPPLDGGRILVGLLPYRAAEAVSRIEPWGFFVVLALAYVGVIGLLWMEPLSGATYGLLKLALLPFSWLAN
ncbi:MAG: site-2 protease family protein [Betaproteobacteria bacterium]